MDAIILLLDFGSTFTEVIAIDLNKEIIIGNSQSPHHVRCCNKLVKAKDKK